jgi:hypothetical protein
VNIAVVLGFDAAVLYLCGFKALMYLALGTVMGGGMHPMAGHLISEHYMFIKARHRRCVPYEAQWKAAGRSLYRSLHTVATCRRKGETCPDFCCQPGRSTFLLHQSM